MKDVLLNVGSIVAAEIGEEVFLSLIIGKRQVHKKKNYLDDGYHYKAWDYKGVPYPEGTTNDDYYFFNHTDIQNIHREEKEDVTSD